MDFDIRHNIADVRRGLSDAAQRQLPYAVMLALNETAAGMIADNQKEMAVSFDRPTRWTLNAFHFRRARKGDLSITVERKLPARARHYLEVQADGGVRPFTGWERQLAQRLAYAGRVGYVAATKHMRRDGHGNVSRAEMQRVLSRIGAQTNEGANATDRSRKRNPGHNYFVAKQDSKLRPGIYKRDAAGGISRVIAFDVASPNYSRRFDFQGTMMRSAILRFPAALAKAIAAALRTAR